jgi:hypothetical protein
MYRSDPNLFYQEKLSLLMRKIVTVDYLTSLILQEIQQQKAFDNLKHESRKFAKEYQRLIEIKEQNIARLMVVLTDEPLAETVLNSANQRIESARTAKAIPNISMADLICIENSLMAIYTELRDSTPKYHEIFNTLVYSCIDSLEILYKIIAASEPSCNPRPKKSTKKSTQAKKTTQAQKKSTKRTRKATHLIRKNEEGRFESAEKKSERPHRSKKKK